MFQKSLVHNHLVPRKSACIFVGSYFSLNWSWLIKYHQDTSFNSYILSTSSVWLLWFSQNATVQIQMTCSFVSSNRPSPSTRMWDTTLRIFHRYFLFSLYISFFPLTLKVIWPRFEKYIVELCHWNVLVNHKSTSFLLLITFFHSSLVKIDGLV